jgi:hypothetical protein
MKRSMFFGALVVLLSMGLMLWGCSENLQNPVASNPLAKAAIALAKSSSANSLAATPYEPDPNTALLDHFNGTTAGTAFGSPSYENSLPAYGQAINLVGGDYVKYAYPSWFERQGTVEMWVKLRQGPYSGILVLQWLDVTSVPQWGYVGNFLLNQQGKLAWGVWNGQGDGVVEGKTTIPLNEWTHIAVTWGANGTQLYVNGVVDASTSANLWPAFVSTTYVYLHYWGNADLGYVDELRISKVARSAEEIRAQAVRVQPLPTPVVSATVNSYSLGKGNVTVSWGAIANAAGYSVDLGNGDLPVTTTSTSLTTNIASGTYTVAVRALAAIPPATSTTYLDSDAGLSSFTLIHPEPLATPGVDGTVTYSSPSAGASASLSSLWPANSRMVTVTFSGAASTGTGTLNASWNVANATRYIVNNSPTTSTSYSATGPGTYTVSVIAVPALVQYGTNYISSDVGTASFTVNAGSASYQFTDEYGEFSYSGSLSDGSFGIPLSLRASRDGSDLDGRVYTFTVTATNGGGSSVSNSATSIVPHDQRK